MEKQFKYIEIYDPTTSSLHIINTDGCDWEDGVGYAPDHSFCGECSLICAESCAQRTAIKQRLEVRNIMKVKRMIEVEEELTITGATLLSIEEAEKLPARLRDYDYWWWLRSPGDRQAYAVRVYAVYMDIDTTDIFGGEYTDYHNGYVRPALLISNLESSNLKIGDCFKFGNKKFEIISNTMAFCTSDIGHSCFRLNYKANNANDYEVSDIKQYIDKWFENAKEQQ